MRMVRSGKAHGRIVSVDTSAARALPGVVAVWTNADIADLSPIDFRADKNRRGLKPNFASRRWRATACAMSAIRSRRCSPRTPISPRTRPSWSTVEIEELPVVLSASDPPGEFEPGRSSEAIVLRHSYGDIDAAFRNAHAVIELDLQTGRHSGVPLETRGAIGRYDAARDLLELHGAAKIPHRNRETLCRMLKPQPVGAACARKPCRRRLRHPRRTLSRGRAGAGRRACGLAGR